MAYTCVLAPSHECDGCQECEQNNRQYDPRWDSEYNSDYYAEYLCGEEENDDR